jgi:hypothetical protein
MHAVIKTFVLRFKVIRTPKLKKNHEYYDQVQGQMGLTGTKWCDFVVYTQVRMRE